MAKLTRKKKLNPAEVWPKRYSAKQDKTRQCRRKDIGEVLGKIEAEEMHAFS